ncbi:hypothetical protein [Streptomyces sp. NPDC059271]|uniref:hypothetical protein n=1 Tax=Streptomyces sp. NPDC059271 TaxID=3346799 RepID=UPI0036CEAA51
MTRTHEPPQPLHGPEDSPTGEPLNFQMEIPEPHERAAGIVAHFAYFAEEGWRVSGTVADGTQGLVIAKLEVWPEGQTQEHTQSVTSRMLRSIPLGQILAAAQNWAKNFTIATVPTIQTADEILAAHTPDTPAPGRAPLPDELMRQVAEGYLLEIASGLRGAVQRLAERLGRPEKTVSNWVAKARKDGWLGPAAQGRAGAAPGPRLTESRRSPRP